MRPTEVSVVVIILIGLMFIFWGSHNIDNAWNAKYYEKTFDVEIKDSNLFLSFDINQLYMLGQLMINIGVVLLILAALISFVSYEDVLRK